MRASASISKTLYKLIDAGLDPATAAYAVRYAPVLLRGDPDDRFVQLVTDPFDSHQRDNDEASATVLTPWGRIDWITIAFPATAIVRDPDRWAEEYEARLRDAANTKAERYGEWHEATSRTYLSWRPRPAEIRDLAGIKDRLPPDPSRVLLALNAERERIAQRFERHLDPGIVELLSRSTIPHGWYNRLLRLADQEPGRGPLRYIPDERIVPVCAEYPWLARFLVGDDHCGTRLYQGASVAEALKDLVPDAAAVERLRRIPGDLDFAWSNIHPLLAVLGRIPAHLFEHDGAHDTWQALLAPADRACMTMSLIHAHDGAEEPVGIGEDYARSAEAIAETTWRAVGPVYETARSWTDIARLAERVKEASYPDALGYIMPIILHRFVIPHLPLVLAERAQPQLHEVVDANLEVLGGTYWGLDRFDALMLAAFRAEAEALAVIEPTVFGTWPAPFERESADAWSLTPVCDWADLAEAGGLKGFDAAWFGGRAFTGKVLALRAAADDGRTAAVVVEIETITEADGPKAGAIDVCPPAKDDAAAESLSASVARWLERWLPEAAPALAGLAARREAAHLRTSPYGDVATLVPREHREALRRIGAEHLHAVLPGDLPAMAPTEVALLLVSDLRAFVPGRDE